MSSSHDVVVVVQVVWKDLPTRTTRPRDITIYESMMQK